MMSDLDRNLGSHGQFEIPLPGTALDDIPAPYKPDFNPADQNGYVIGGPPGTPAAVAAQAVQSRAFTSHVLAAASWAISVPAGTPFAGGLGYPPVMWEGDGAIMQLSFAALVAAAQAQGVSGADVLRMRLVALDIVDTAAAPAGQLVLLEAVLAVVGTKNTYSRRLSAPDPGRAGFHWFVSLDSNFDLRGLDLDPAGPSNSFSLASIRLSFANLDVAAAHAVSIAANFAIDVFHNSVT